MRIGISFIEELYSFDTFAVTKYFAHPCGSEGSLYVPHKRSTLESEVSSIIIVKKYIKRLGIFISTLTIGPGSESVILNSK